MKLFLTAAALWLAGLLVLEWIRRPKRWRNWRTKEGEAIDKAKREHAEFCKQHPEGYFNTPGTIHNGMYEPTGSVEPCLTPEERKQFNKSARD